MAEQIKEQGQKLWSNILEGPLGNDSSRSKIVIVAILVYLSLKWFNFLMAKRKDFAKGSPMLVTNVHHGLNPAVINTSNPARDNFIELPRSTNEEYGEEFTFSVWLNIADLTHNDNSWKHVFHRGNRSNKGVATPGRAPAVYFHPKSNAIRVYMNTIKEPFDYIDIHNIPIKKWFHLAIMLRDKNLDIYFNGRLKERKVLSSLPKQNHGDVYLTHEKGFNGFLTRLQYFGYAIHYSTLQGIINSGPGADGENSCLEVGANSPPYFTNSWWKSRYGSPNA